MYDYFQVFVCIYIFYELTINSYPIRILVGYLSLLKKYSGIINVILKIKKNYIEIDLI
jgi:hypothetical protein